MGHRAWKGGELFIVERRVEGFFEDTLLSTPDTESAVEAVRAAIETCGDVEWYSPVPRPLAQTRGARLPKEARRFQKGELEAYVWGAPGEPSFEQRAAYARSRVK